MVALILFILGIYCFEKKGDRVSYYLILQFLALNGYAMLTWDYEFVRKDDLALVMVLYSFLRKGMFQMDGTKMARMIYAYLAAVLMCVLVSFIYYQIPIVQIVKGARTALYVLVFFDLKSLGRKGFETLFQRIYILTSVACLLFCLESLTGFTPTITIRGTGFLGLSRSYDYPPLVAFGCMYSVFVTDRKSKWFYPLLVLPFLTLLIIQSRGMLMSVLLLTALGISLKANESNKIYISVFALGLSVFLISSLIFGGETGDTTLNDVGKITSGEFASMDYEHEGSATFAYRLNLLAISIIKTVEEPVRVFFGSGILVEMPYSFFERWDMVESCRFSKEDYNYFSPDITLSNVIYNIGLMGLIVYFSMIYLMLKMLLKWAKGNNNLEITGVMFVLYLLFIAFDSSILTWPNYLIVPFFFVQYVRCRHKVEPVSKLLLLLLLFKSGFLTRYGLLTKPEEQR